MSYYLSDTNKKFIEPYINLLKKSNKNQEFNVTDPKRFAYILRNAFHVLDKSLVDKYTIKIKESRVVCSLKLPDSQPEYEVIDLPQTVYQIATHLTIYKPNGIIFSNADCDDEDDRAALERYCEANGYKIDYDIKSNKLTIERLSI